MPDQLKPDLKTTQYSATRYMRWGFKLLAVFFIVFLAGYSWLSWQEVKRDQSAELSSIAELSGNSLDSYFSHYEYSLKVLAQELIEKHGLINVIHSRPLLKKFLQAHPDLLIANVILPNGQILVSSGGLPGLPLPSLAKVPSFIIGRDELLKGGDFIIGRPLYGSLSKEWIIPMRYAIRDKKGGLLYILAASLPLSRQQSFWHDLSLPENTTLGLLRDDAYLISRYPDIFNTTLDEAYGTPRTGVLIEHLKQHAFPLRGNVDGYSSLAKTNHLYGFRRLSHYPVTLFVSTPISNLYKIWWQQVRLTYLLLLLFIFGGYFVYRWTLKNQLAWESDRERHEEKFRAIYDGLLESEERFRRVADEAPFPMMIHAENGEVLEINKVWSEATGYTHADIPTIGSWLTLAHDTNAQDVKLLIEKVYGISHRIDQGEQVIRCKDGSTRTWHFSAAPVGQLPDGRRYVVSMAKDITEQKKTERAALDAKALLHDSEESFANIINLAVDAIISVNEEQRIFVFNQGAEQIFGYTAAEMLGQPLVKLLPERFAAAHPGHLRQFAKEPQAARLMNQRSDFLGRRKDGSEFFAEASISQTMAGGKRIFTAYLRDITERKAAQQQIEFLAYHDALTKLPNRLLAKDHLEQAILVAERENTRVALLFIDLDNFKTINDSLGHAIGDSLLKSVSIRLRECLRDIDTLSRQGGDEFLIVLGNMRDTEAITVVAEKILERMEEPFEIDHHELAISLSIGIAVYPDDGKDFDTLLKQSDTAMYQAKEAGRNTYRFHTAQMNIDAIEHLRMRNGLRCALEHGEFVLHYQPQISLATGAVIGAEALIRWRHPELGMVPPGRFISIAEDSGLIVPIGDWVLREACRQAVAWRRAGLPELLIAVNLSAVQFKRGDVEKSVTQALAESGLNPALLELELTESILIKDTEKVLVTVGRLKSLGVKLSIDDFGTGYSSLSYLKRFNVDKLKIDQSFVRDMADDPNDAAIVSAIIQMAKSLNLTTIAEGVEDERQLALLRLQHCDEVQGYYFARPMPAAEFENFMAKRHE